MKDETVIKVDHLSKKYCKELRHTMLYGIQDIARNAIGLSSDSGRIRDGEFWALDDVSFEIKRGETLGIIGANGSGKTTLLKLLNGILMPDKGRIEIRGKVGALIEIGAGFHPMLTGRENIYVNGAILGMSKKEIDKKFDEISDFSGIGDFIDTPVKHYSSGMYVRLGFAIAVHCEPDILVIDEVLAVGDIQFQIKCFRKAAEFKEMGKTIILVTHDMGAIQRHTGRVILLDRGLISSVDTPKNAINRYLAMMSGGFEEVRVKPKKLKPISAEIEEITSRKSSEANIEYDLCPKRKNYNSNEFRYGNGSARIIDFELLDGDGKEVVHIQSMGTVVFRVKIRFYENVKKPVFGMMVKTKDGAEIYGNNTLYKEISIESQVNGSELSIEYSMKFNVQSGDYFFSAGVAELVSGDIVPLDRRYDLAHIAVLPADKSSGIVNMNAVIKVYYGI